MLWVYIVSASCLFINAEASAAEGTPLGALDFCGWGLFALGFGLQVRWEFDGVQCFDGVRW